MHSTVIKFKYGYTLDRNNPCDEPCPKCGRVVCHVKEDPYKVFCANTFCDFHDTYDMSWNKPIIERFKKFLRYPPIFLYRLDSLYSEFKCPFISEEDIKAGKFIIREFELDEELYNSPVSRWGGANKADCYKRDSYIIVKYGNLELMVNDGWRLKERHDVRI